MLDRVLLERRHDQLLLAIDLATRQCDATVRMMDQRLGQGIGIGENLDAAFAQELAHLERRGAAIDDDGIAIAAQRDRSARDGPFGRDIERLADLEGAGRQRRCIARHRRGTWHRLQSASHPDRRPHLGKPGKITPDRGLGRARGTADIANTHQRLLVQHPLD